MPWKRAAAEQLRSGGSLAENLIRFRAGQLANGVAVLAADFGFREAVASGDVPTILSAARNNAQRIGADLVLVLDTRGQVLASTAPQSEGGDGSLEGLLSGGPTTREQPIFHIFGSRSYQVFLAPVRTPETIAWVAMGFVVDERWRRRSARWWVPRCRSSRTAAARACRSPRPCRRTRARLRRCPSMTVRT